MLCELRQKDALCPPIALAERVKLVGADVKINEGVYKIVEGKALEEILLGQPPENSRADAWDLICGAELRTLFGDVDAAGYTGPFVEVAEKMAVDGLVMLKVEGRAQGRFFPLCCFRGDEHGFHTVKLLLTAEVEFIDKDGSAGIAVGRRWVDRVGHKRYLWAAVSCSCRRTSRTRVAASR